jgi:hypothetical protein
MVRECVECQMFAGKKKLLPLPLRPIRVETLFNSGDWILLVKLIPIQVENTNGSFDIY